MNGNLAYQEDWREELIGGKLVAMSPRPAFNHNRISSNIFRIFANYLDKKKCEAIADGTDLFLSEIDWFIPDFMVVCDRDKIQMDGVHGAPDLVVEVLSPSTAQNDRGHKKEVYAKCGVREYWIVSPDNKSVEIYLNEDAELVFHKVYTVVPGWMLEKMKAEERAEVVTRFRCSLYDDLELSLDDIFNGLLI